MISTSYVNWKGFLQVISGRGSVDGKEGIKTIHRYKSKDLCLPLKALSAILYSALIMSKEHATFRFQKKKHRDKM